MKPKYRPRMVSWLLLLCVYSPDLAARQGGTATTDEIERYSQEADQAMARKDMERAAAALEKLAQLTPKVPEVQANLGMVYYREGRYDRAAAAFELALTLNSKTPNARVMLGICFAELRRNKEAVALLEPAFKSPPDKSVKRVIGLELQRAYSALGQYANAENVSNDLLSRFPNDPEILYFASRLRGDRALQLITELIDVAPNSVWVHLASAQVLEHEKHYDSAISQYRMALKMDPRLPGVHFGLGRVLLLDSNGEKAKEEARQEFLRELAIDPGNFMAEYEIGEIYHESGQTEQAHEHFLRAIQKHPEFEDGQIGLARVLISLKKPDEALPHLLAAVRVNPASEVSHFLLARVYQSLGDASHHEKEMTLFRKYHARPYSATAAQLPADSPASTITKQTLSDSQADRP